MPGKGELIAAFRAALADGTFVDAVLSAPVGAGPDVVRRVEVRPVSLRGAAMCQFASRTHTQVTHANLAPDAAVARFVELLGASFRSAVVRTAAADLHVAVVPQGKVRIRRSEPTRSVQAVDHDRQKRYLIPEDQPCAFLHRLGVMTETGRVIAAKQAKFRQINRYLEMVADVVSALPDEGPLRVIDFGSGKSYLTFSLHHYLRTVLGRDATVTGLDLKRDVIAECQAIARDLDAEGLTFEVGDIAGFAAEGPVDMVVSLHACDTATDDALAKAVAWGARVILAAPCCQHELARQIANETMQPILKHGILRERLAAIVTDALRAERLELTGYKVQVLEFIETEHTPKNLLIRAVKRPGTPRLDRAPYDALKAFWHADPHIDRALDRR